MKFFSWRHTILISSLLPSYALLPFLSAPFFPKPPISVLPHACLLCPFLFQFPSFLLSSSFIFYFIIYYMACNKASVLLLKTDDHSSSETKKNPSKPPQTHTHFSAYSWPCYPDFLHAFPLTRSNPRLCIVVSCWESRGNTMRTLQIRSF